MTDEQKYLFDLQGFIVLKGVVPQTVIDSCNEVLDRYEQMPSEEYPPPLCLGTQRTEQELYISNILEADSTFNTLIDIPEVLGVIQGVTGGPYRLNHTYTIYRWGGRLYGTAHARDPNYSKMSVPLPKWGDGVHANKGSLSNARL